MIGDAEGKDADPRSHETPKKEFSRRIAEKKGNEVTDLVRAVL